jgi:pilus assembly protein CpaC
LRINFLTLILGLFLLWFSALSGASDQSTFTEKVTVGHAKLIKLSHPASRVSIADPKVADITVLNSSEIYVLGKSVGTTNLILWNKKTGSRVCNISVENDLEPLRSSLKEVVPEEKDVHVSQSSGSVILTGSVANVITADKVLGLAEAYLQNIIRASRGAGSPSSENASTATSQTASSSNNAASGGRPKVINFLKIRDPQQVMLQVKIAEISKSLLDQIGVNLTGTAGGGSKFSIVSNFPTPNSTATSGAALLSLFDSKTVINGQKNDALVKVLIPQTNGLGQASTAEFLYGIGLKFTPTVLDNSRINLKVTPEVSDISQQLVLQGSNTQAILPNFTIRTVSTTVQIREGETLVIGGLMKNNVTENLQAFPVLGELPVIGALFRSKGFVSDMTELVVIITPSFVYGSNHAPQLPTDKFSPPSRSEFFLGNSMQKEVPSDAPGGVK